MHRRGLLLRVEDRREELHELLRLDAREGFLRRDEALVHHVGRDPHGGETRALAVARLEQIELAVLDRELEVLHVAEALLEQVPHPQELAVRLRHRLFERLARAVAVQRPRRADAGHDVFALRVRQELAVELLLARGRVAREGDAGGRRLAAVAEDHRLDVDGRAPVVGNLVELAVRLGALVVPGLEDRADRAPELLARVVRKFAARLAADDRLVLPDDVGQVLRVEVRVGGDAARLLLLRQDVLEVVARHAKHDVRVHLDEAPAAVEREPLPRRGGEAGQSLRREPEVQDRVHHARHRGARARPHGHEQGILRVAEPLAGRLLDARERRVRLGLHPVERLLPPVLGADGRVNREARRDGNAQRRHLREARALAAESLFAEPRAFRLAVSEEVDLFHFSTFIFPPRSRKSLPAARTPARSIRAARGDSASVRPRGS